MHWMDRIGAAITSRPGLYEPLFSDGWGDFAAVPTAVQSRDLRTVESRPISRSAGLEVDEIRFESPAASVLPRACAMANAIVYRPEHAHRMAILFAAFNDHGYTTRGRLATELASAGIATTILESPFYGQRRTRKAQVMQSVDDFLRLGYGTVCEAAGLARWFAAAGWTVGYSGYSMGGSIAAYAAAATPELPVAIAPIAAAHSPSAVYVDAVLSSAVAWDRLGPDGRGRLRSTLDTISTLGLAAPAAGQTAVLLAAVGDGYVPLTTSRKLADHWRGSELRVVPGGHASLLRERTLHVKAITDAFDRFEAWTDRDALSAGTDNPPRSVGG